MASDTLQFCGQFKKGVDAWVTLFFISSNGIAWMSGVTYSDLFVAYIPPGSIYTQKVITASDFDNMENVPLGFPGGYGFYKVKFSAADLPIVGRYLIYGYTFQAFEFGGFFDVVENLNDDIAGLIAGLNNFDVTSEKVLLNDGTQGQIDAVETASGNLDDTISSRAPAGEYDAEMANLDASVSSRAVPGDITAAHAITDAKIDTIETNNITGVPE